MLSSQDKIKHLYWRSGFGLSPEEWKKAQDLTLQSHIKHIFNTAAKAGNIKSEIQERSEAEFKKLSKEERKALLKKEKQLVIKQNAEWVVRMSDKSESAFLEKMSLFWHGHFACITKRSKHANQQLNTIRTHALGNFRTFVHAIAKDVSMIRFLNNQQNKKRSPNENFARELMELFTIGRGHYSEQDIKEAARAFTGWSSDFRGDFVFKKRHHDYGQKTFMGKTGDFDGGDIIDIILDRPETASFICQKIYRFFINEKINEQRLAKLSKRFHNSDYDIKDLMLHIFSSDWFYDKENVGTKIKSPLELLAGIMRTFDVNFKTEDSILFVEKALGQVLFKPPNVAGWAEGKNWIDNSTLMIRLNLVAFLFQATDINFKIKEEFESKKRNKAVRKIKADIDLKPLLNQYTDSNENETFEHLSQYLIQGNFKVKLKNLQPYLAKSDQENFIKSLALRLMSLPEYQVC